MAQQTSTPAIGFLLGSYATIGGAMLWFVHLFGVTILASYACRTGDHLPMHVLTVVTGAGTIGAMFASWRVMRRDVGRHGERNAFLGKVGMLLNAISLVLIVAEGVPNWIRGLC